MFITYATCESISLSVLLPHVHQFEYSAFWYKHGLATGVFPVISHGGKKVQSNTRVFTD